MTKLFITLFILFLPKDELLAGSIEQFKPDTINFSKGSSKVDSLMKLKLDSLALEINKYPNEYFTVSCYIKKIKSSDLSYGRGAKIINYLVRKGNVKQERLNMYYGIIGKHEMVIIRFSIGEELLGTHCGFPLFPELKK